MVSECTEVVLSQTLADSVKLHVTGVVRSRFKLPAEGPPFSGTTRVLTVDVTRTRSDDVAEALRELIGRTPEHPGILPVLDAGVRDGKPFIVTPDLNGEPLDAALRVYGPAALADALPRLQQLADALDAAAACDECHGALTTGDIIVGADETFVVGIGVAAALSRAGVRLPAHAPYAAPEVVNGDLGTSSADQFALAMIAFEWLFGRRFDAVDDAPAATFALPGLDADALWQAFAKATSADAGSRYGSCTDFVAAIARSTEAHEPAPARVLTFSPAVDGASELPLQPRFESAPEVFEHEGDNRGLQRVELGAVHAGDSVAAGFGGGALALAFALGIGTGGFAMWLHVRGERAAAPIAADAVLNSTAGHGTEADVPPARQALATAAASEVLAAPQSSSPDAAVASELDAGLLVHSAPAGALVTIDGTPRGTTPVAVRGLDLGTRQVKVSRPGYQTVERQIVLTPERPSRALEVELSPLRPVAAQSQVAAGGSIVIDSRPSGATVIVDGRMVGVTPVTLTVPAGLHTVRMERSGYRAVSTRVEVKAGEKTRVAARLEGGQDE